jgi:sialic acid synthase SpsE
MQVIAEVGTSWLPKKFPLQSAINAALDCGADLVKIQFWRNGEALSRRRGGAKALEKWSLSMDDMAELLDIDHGPPLLGCSVFDDEDAEELIDANICSEMLAFIKTATQEYQCAGLAETVSCLSRQGRVPLYVSVPQDGCLVMGNYSSPLPITWMQCAPRYPASVIDYSEKRQVQMMERLPGKFGLSDHTENSILLRLWTANDCSPKLDCVEKHFCYNEKLRKLVPDGGPWSLSRKAFKEYVKVAHGG